MLQDLRIKHFAIIDEVELSFSKGFNVLTGETGAGKSIILNAVHLLLGDRATEELIRSSEEEASVEALFELSGNRRAKEKVQEKHSPLEDSGEESLLIRRTLSRSGRGKVFLNGNLATLGMLSEVSEELLSICGQHEHQTLQRPDTHIDLLDEFGGLTGLPKELELRGKTILITGAGRGLGAAMAKGLARRGADLALVDLDEAGHADVREACRALGVRAETYRATVAAEADVVGTFDRVVADLGRLDGAIANAGILRDGLLVKAKDSEITGKLSLAHWQAVIDVNLTGVFLCGREAAERMIRLRNGGCIVNISSLSRAGNFGQSNYSAAKAGVAALTVVWAKASLRRCS